MDKSYICDSCGLEKTSKYHPIYDENYNKQLGLKECDECFTEKLNNEKNQKITIQR